MRANNVETRPLLDEALSCADKICATRSREFDHRVAGILYTLVDIIRISGVVSVTLKRKGRVQA